jgi:hypothetical protein
LLPPTAQPEALAPDDEPLLQADASSAETSAKSANASARETKDRLSR